MNPLLENLLSTQEKAPLNLGDADAVLDFLYEAYTELNNLDNAQIKLSGCTLNLMKGFLKEKKAERD